ncbi:MAG TPA: DUF4349 domain-containing protein [Pseudonocardiaceae bacterium]|jgi:hypothetical protein
MRRRVVLALGAIVLIGLSAGCSASNGSSSSDGSAGLQHNAVAPAPAPNSGAAGRTANGAPNGAPSKGSAPNLPSTATGRQVIRTATVAMTTNDVSTAVTRAEQIADGAGGYLGAENVDDGSATVTLSVPQPQLDGVLRALARVGKVTSQQQQSQDVTAQLVDVSSRIATQQASVARVRQLLNQATSISDIVQIEGELTTREADLESMEHQQAELTGQAAMSTVNLQIDRVTPPPPAQAAGPAPGFGSGITGGWHALGQTVRVISLVLGAALPFLLGIGIPVLVVLWLIRRRRTAKAS